MAGQMIGRTISHYKILDRIGAGGMGEVFKAEDLRLSRTVALKFLPADLSLDTHANRRFMHEARAASSLEHPNICSIHEVDTAPDGRMFICMSFCDGEPLRDIIGRGPLPAKDAVKIAVKTAEGLAAAHKAGVVHRDIKPANIIVARDGGVKIIDFGLAKLAGASRVTRPGTTLGTIAYKSPEQTHGDEVDGRADVWSLGMVLFEMLTGDVAFGADFDQATVYSILNETPRRVGELRADVPPELEGIVARCLEKDPANRYRSARELARALDRLAVHERWSSVSIDAGGDNGNDDGVKHGRIRFAIVAAVAVIAAAMVLYTGRGVWERWIPGEDGGRHIAVLRFASVGTDETLAAFCDGLVETLASKLTQLEPGRGTSLWVVPASEIRQREIDSVTEAREAFGVDLAVTGSVQRIGGGLRVIVNLVDADSDRQLKSAFIDDPMTDASVLQDSTVVALASMLDIDIPPESRDRIVAGGTGMAEAYGAFLEGLGYLQRRDKIVNIDKAIERFGYAVELDPGYALAYAGLGEAYWRMYEERRDTSLVDIARAHCGTAIEIDDMLAPVHVTLGIIDGGTGRFPQAVAEFKRALQLDPDNFEAQLELANVYRSLGWKEEAERGYSRAIEMRLEPDNWRAYSHLGVFYYMQDNLEAAVEMTLKVTELYPGYVRAYNNLIGFYYFLGDIENARKMFDVSVALDPDAQSYANMGTLYIYEGRYDDAIPMLEKAVELAENDAAAWGNLADAYRYAPGTKPRSIPAYRRAIELAGEQLAVNPEDAGLRALMAVQMAKAGATGEAIAEVETAMRRKPDDQIILFNAAIVYEIAGRRDDALRLLEHAVAAGNLQKIEKEPELESLRASDEFRRLVSP